MVKKLTWDQLIEDLKLRQQDLSVIQNTVS